MIYGVIGCVWFEGVTGYGIKEELKTLFGWFWAHHFGNQGMRFHSTHIWGVSPNPPNQNFFLFDKFFSTTHYLFFFLFYNFFNHKLYIIIYFLSPIFFSNLSHFFQTFPKSKSNSIPTCEPNAPLGFNYKAL